MSIIGEAILSASIEMLFKKLASTELLHFACQEQIHDDLDKWKNTLLKIHAVLDDAEEKQTSNRLVKIWLDELKNLAYDIEDILEEFTTEALRNRLLLIEPDQASTSKLRKLIPTCFSVLNPRSVKFNVKMRSKMKEISARLQEISMQKSGLDLKENSGGRRSNKVRDQRTPSTSLNEAHIYGREQEKEAMLELLLRDEGRLSVIPIIGMGGLGKTTLARLVYNDDRLEGRFDFKVWVCVSEDFDVARVTKTILQSVSGGIGTDVNDLNTLQVKLKEKLSGKKFLLVLDDVWNENYEDWTILSCPFEAGSPGSKIVVTTRNHVVTSMVGTLPAYRLKKLSNDDCLCVFTKHSLGTTDFSVHPHLKEVGLKIVERCDGLPLAAKALGGLLRDKYEANDWENVLNSKIWEIPEKKTGIIPALRLSYHYLPPHLKRCFAYCSMFLKDYEFHKKEIILLWMAEGFLQHESEKQMEDLGDEYFRDLQSMSFFQQSSNDISKFGMHDLINDLAQWAMGETCFRMENMLENNKHQMVSKNLRHFSYVAGEYDGVQKFEGLHDAKHLRTFLPLMPRHFGGFYLTCKILHMLLQLRCLRALSLRGYCIFELPDAIGDLKLLRYLDLSYTEIETLPESLCSLYNLETLILHWCKGLKKLFADIGNLVNLRYIYNDHVYSLEEMPRRIGKLTSLRILCNFVVGEGTGSRLGELKSLVHLRETLCISRLENVKDVMDAREADLNGKRDIDVLLLEWSRDMDVSRNSENETSVLDKLQPNRKLKELTISFYGGIKFPTWLGDPSFSNLVVLKFEGCGNCTSLPSVGQLPLLKDLVIKSMTGVKSVGLEFYGTGTSKPFPSLETLCFEDMKEWIEWIHHGTDQEVEGFHLLRKLSIVRSPELLGSLPKHLPSLESLIIKECQQLSVSVQNLPKLCILEVDGCKEVVERNPVNLSSLNSVVLSDISSPMFQAKQFLQGLAMIKEVKIAGCRDLTSFWRNGIELLQDISSVQRLEIARCPHLLSLVAEEGEEQHEQGLPFSLQHLILQNCECLVKLPQALWNLISLREVSIFECPKLVSLPEVGLPSQLRSIRIENCNVLESLPEAWMSNCNTSLEKLYIHRCDSLTYIARKQLPPNLKQLEIRYCKSLRSVVDEGEVSAIHEEIINSRTPSLLEDLNIGDCPSLTSLFSNSQLPAMLQRIHLHTCSNLEALPDDLHKLSHIQMIWIWDCPNIGSFPEGGLPINLAILSICNCEKLEGLPNSMHNLSSLQDLTIWRRCPGIVSFPEGGFPTNLTSLDIEDVNICKPLFEWGLHRLTSLRRLSIRGGCPDVVSFPHEEIGMVLPASLTHLAIEDFPNLKALSSIVLNLTSLEYLWFMDCPKLKSLPKKGLPPSLLQLYIQECPLLQKRCEKDKGKYWSIIVHIPYIEIDGENVFDPNEDSDFDSD